MNVRTVTLLGAITLALLSSCETVSEIQLPHKIPRPVINCKFYPDSVWFMSVTMSKSVLESSPYVNDQLKNASVTITSNDGESFEIPYFVFQQGETVFREGYRSQGFYPQTGKNYTLQVTIPGYETVAAESNVPPTVDINNVIITSPLVENEPIHARISFNDPIGRINYYAIAVYYLWEYTYVEGNEQVTRMSFTEANLEMEKSEGPLNNSPTIPKEVLVSDNLFDGLTHSIPIIIQPSYNFDNDKKIIFCLRSVSRDYYLYKKTKLLQLEAEKNPFAQPVQVYNNIENGFGLFAGYSEFRYEYVK